MKRILFSLLLLTTILSCRNEKDPRKEIDPNSFFLRLEMDGLSYEITEKEATGECFMLTSHVNGPDLLRVIDIMNVLQYGCPRLPVINMGIVLDLNASVNPYTIKTDDFQSHNRIDLSNGTFYSGGGMSVLPAELIINLTKIEPPGGYIEGTIKGIIVKSTPATGAQFVKKTVPIEGSFRVLSK